MIDVEGKTGPEILEIFGKVAGATERYKSTVSFKDPHILSTWIFAFQSGWLLWLLLSSSSLSLFNQHFGSGFTVLIAKTDASKILQKKSLAIMKFGFRRMWRILHILEGVAEVDNTLWDLQNSSYPTKARFNIIALLFLQNNSKFKLKQGVYHANLGWCMFIFR